MYNFKKILNTNNGDIMDINEALSIIPRSLISLVTLFIATKILGKKQVSELSLFDYVIGISIGNFTAEMILVLDNQLINGVVAILTFGIMGYIISYISTKSIIFRRFMIGTPTIIMSNGKILYNALKKLNIDINDFLEQARIAGYFDITQINYAIMEANGDISFLLKEDSNSNNKQGILPANVIIDSNIMHENIKETDKSESWFIKELKKQGYTSYENILLATYSNNNLTINRKNENIKPKNVLE